MIMLWKAELLLMSGDPDMFYPESDGPTFCQVWQTMKPLLEKDADFGYDPKWERLYQTVLLVFWSGHRKDGHDLGRLLALMRVILPGSNYLAHEREGFAQKRRIIAGRDGAEEALAELEVIPERGMDAPDSDNLAAWNYLRLHQFLAPEIPVYLTADPARCDERDWRLTLDLLRGCSLEPIDWEKRKRHTGLEQDARAFGMDEAFVREIIRHENALAVARRERQSFGARMCREPDAWTLEKAGPEARRLWQLEEDAEDALLRDYGILSAARVNPPEVCVELAKACISVRHDEAVVIFRNGTCVAVPGFVREPGEDVKECALRLLREEAEENDLEQYHYLEYDVHRVRPQPRQDDGRWACSTTTRSFLSTYFWYDESMLWIEELLRCWLLRDAREQEVVWVVMPEDEEDYLHLTEQNPCDKLKKS